MKCASDDAFRLCRGWSQCDIDHRDLSGMWRVRFALCLRVSLAGIILSLVTSCGREMSPEEYFRVILLSDEKLAYTEFNGRFFNSGMVHAGSPAVGLIATFRMGEEDFQRLVSRFHCQPAGREPPNVPFKCEDPIVKLLGDHAKDFSGAMVFSDWESAGVDSPISNSNIALLRSSEKVCIYFVRGR